MRSGVATLLLLAGAWSCTASKDQEAPATGTSQRGAGPAESDTGRLFGETILGGLPGGFLGSALIEAHHTGANPELYTRINRPFGSGIEQFDYEMFVEGDESYNVSGHYWLKDQMLVTPGSPREGQACSGAVPCPTGQQCVDGRCIYKVFDELYTISTPTPGPVPKTGELELDLEQNLAFLDLAWRELGSGGLCRTLSDAKAVSSGKALSDDGAPAGSPLQKYFQYSQWDDARRITGKRLPVACGLPLDTFYLRFDQCEDPYLDLVSNEVRMNLGTIACASPGSAPTTETMLLSETIAGATCLWSEPGTPRYESTWPPPPCHSGPGTGGRYCYGYNHAEDYGCAEGVFDFDGVSPSDPEFSDPSLTPEIRALTLRTTGDLEVHATEGPSNNVRKARVDLLGTPGLGAPLPPFQAPFPADDYGADHRFALLNVVPSEGALPDYSMFVPTFYIEAMSASSRAFRMRFMPPRPDSLVEFLGEELHNFGGSFAFKSSYVTGDIELVGSRRLRHILNNPFMHGELSMLKATHTRNGRQDGGGDLGLEGRYSDGAAWDQKRWSAPYTLTLAGPNTEPDPDIDLIDPPPPPSDPRWGGAHQPTTWDIDRLYLRSQNLGSSAEHLDSRFWVTLGASVDSSVELAERFHRYDGPDHKYCVGELQLPVISLDGRPFSNPRIENVGIASHGSYEFDPTDPTERLPAGFAESYDVTHIYANGKNVELAGGGVDPTRGLINLVLPQGQYELAPRVTYDGGSNTGLRRLDAEVRCGEACSVCDNGLVTCVNSDFVSNECTQDPEAHVNGGAEAPADLNITAVFYRVNGGAPVYLCDSDPATTAGPCTPDSSGRVPVSFDLIEAQLPDCVNDIEIMVEAVPANPADGTDTVSCPWTHRIEKLVPIRIPTNVDGCFTSESDARAAIAASVTGGCNPNINVGGPTTGPGCIDTFRVTASSTVCDQNESGDVTAKVDTQAPHKTGELSGCFDTEDDAYAAATHLIDDNCSPPVILESHWFDPSNSCAANLYVETRDSCGNGNAATLSWAAQVDGIAPTATPGTIEPCLDGGMEAAQRAALDATTCSDNPGGCGIKEKRIWSSSNSNDGCNATVSVVCIDNCDHVSDPVIYDVTLLGDAPVATPGAIDLCYADSMSASAAALAATGVTGGCGEVVKNAQVDGECSALVSVTAVDSCGSASNTVTYDTRIDGTAPVLTRGSGVEDMCYRSEEDAKDAALAATTMSDNCPDALPLYQSQLGPVSYAADTSNVCMGTVSVEGTDACGNRALPADYDVKVDDQLPTVTDVRIEPRTDPHQQCFEILSDIAQDNCGEVEIDLLSCSGGKLLNHRSCEVRTRRSCEIIGNEVCFDLAADTNHAYEFTLSVRASDGCDGPVSCSSDADCATGQQCIDGTCGIVEELTVHIDSDRGECPASF